MLQRRITELEQALDRCQKRLEIPTVALTAHPEVEAASRQVGDGRKFTANREEWQTFARTIGATRVGKWRQGLR